jgi:rSAM/selenodomain-associated transferase 2
MTVAVVIPTLNEERIVEATLTHTVGMGFDEVTVVDGGSRDRTSEIVRAFASANARGGQPSASSRFPPQASSVTLVTSPPGRARQMNAGAAASRSQVLLFLHADTRLPPNAKAEIEAALGDPTCDGGRFDVRFERDSGLAWLIARLMNLRSRWTGIATGDQAIFVRRTAFERLGGFYDIPVMEDVDFSRRLKQAGRSAALRAHVVTSFRRWEARGSVRTILLMWVLRFLYWTGVSPDRLRHWYGTVR